MNQKIETIISTLLDESERPVLDEALMLFENIESKIKNAAKIFAPKPEKNIKGFTEEQVREIAKSDPTPEGDYIAFLCRIARDGQWSADRSNDIRELLAHYATLTAKNQSKANKQIFVDGGGKLDIGQYKSLTDMEQHVSAAEKIIYAQEEERKASKGVLPVSTLGDLTLFSLDSLEALRYFAGKPGKMADDTMTFSEIGSHVGKGDAYDKNWPYAPWCSQIRSHWNTKFESCLPLFGIRKGKYPHICMSFDNAETSEAVNMGNRPINGSVAAEIAPLFDDPLFRKYFAPTINEAGLANQLTFSFANSVNNWLLGFADPKTGKRVFKPITGPDDDRPQTLEMSIAMFKRLLPRQIEWYTLLIKSSSNPKPNHVIFCAKIIKKPMVGRGDVGAYAISSAVANLPSMQVEVPEVLQSPEALNAFYEPIFAKVLASGMPPESKPLIIRS